MFLFTKGRITVSMLLRPSLLFGSNNFTMCLSSTLPWAYPLDYRMFILYITMCFYLLGCRVHSSYPVFFLYITVCLSSTLPCVYLVGCLVHSSHTRCSARTPSSLSSETMTSRNTASASITSRIYASCRTRRKNF